MLTLNLSLPPSINRRIAKLGNASPEVKAWIRDCDARLMAARYRAPRYTEDVELEIVWDEKRRVDIDAGLKCLLDYMQRPGVAVYSNDRQVRRLLVSYGPVDGCRIAVRSLPPERREDRQAPPRRGAPEASHRHSAAHPARKAVPTRVASRDK